METILEPSKREGPGESTGQDRGSTADTPPPASLMSSAPYWWRSVPRPLQVIFAIILAMSIIAPALVTAAIRIRDQMHPHPPANSAPLVSDNPSKDAPLR